MVPLDSALVKIVSSYRLSIVTMSLFWSGLAAVCNAVSSSSAMFIQTVSKLANISGLTVPN